MGSNLSQSNGWSFYQIGVKLRLTVDKIGQTLEKYFETLIWTQNDEILVFR